MEDGRYSEERLPILKKRGAVPKIITPTATITFFVVADGEVKIISGDQEIIAGKDQSMFVDGMIPHSIWNNGDKTAVVIKISTER